MNKVTEDGTINISEVGKLSIKEGDVLVLRFPQHLREGAVQLINEKFTKHLLEPLGLAEKVKILVLEGGADISVMTRELIRE